MAVAETHDDFGATLRAAREAAGRTLRELADATKLGVRTLEALERNQIDRLPPGIFRRSVVREYAREVGLDPEVTLRDFLSRHPDSLPAPGTIHSPVTTPPSPGARPWSMVATGVAVIVILVLVAAAYLLWPRPAAVGRGHRPAASTLAQRGGR